jgi:hypothetical protein
MKKLLLFACLISVFSCTKDEESSKNPTYESSGTISSSPVIMYTSEGKVENAEVVKSFVERNGAGTLFYPGTDHDKLTYDVSLTFNGNIATEKSIGQSIEYDTIRKDNGISFLVDRKTSMSLPLDTSKLDCYNVNRLIGANPAPFTCQSDECASKTQSPISFQDGKILRPIINFCFVRNSAAQSCVLRRNNFSDYFNYHILSKLQTGDTLVVQTCTYVLYKK